MDMIAYVRLVIRQILLLYKDFYMRHDGICTSQVINGCGQVLNSKTRLLWDKKKLNRKRENFVLLKLLNFFIYMSSNSWKDEIGFLFLLQLLFKQKFASEFVLLLTDSQNQPTYYVSKHKNIAYTLQWYNNDICIDSS